MRRLSFHPWPFLWCLSLFICLSGILHLANRGDLAAVLWLPPALPWLPVFLVPATLAAYIGSRPYLSLSFLCQAVIIVVLFMPQFINKNEGDVGGAMMQDMKIMSFNVWTKNNQIEKVAQIFNLESPDILFLQEITVEQYKQLDLNLGGIKSKHKYHVALLEEHNLVVVSRLPILNQENISRLPMLKRDNIINERIKIQKVTLQGKDRNIQAYNVHFLRKFWSSRAREIQFFVEHEIANTTTPIILAGDFNATPFDMTYRTISRHLSNVHEQAGHGFGFTYPTPNLAKNWPVPIIALARIDHIFLSDHFTVSTAETLRLSGGSDHYPVKTDVILKFD